MSTLFDVLEATWPAAETLDVGPVRVRRGAGGGKRVSAATVRADFDTETLTTAEKQMSRWGQPPLYQVRTGDDALDDALVARGFDKVDPTILRVGPIAPFIDTPLPRVTAFAIWEPLEIMREIWAAGGIGPGRLAVMERVAGPKTAIFGRVSDKPAGAAFAAIHDGTLMVHAVEVLPEFRRKGMARWMMRAAGLWAVDRNAEQVAVAVTQANAGANALYASFGLEPVKQYHYRIAHEGVT